MAGSLAVCAFSPLLRPLVSAKMVSGRGWRVAEDDSGQDFGKAEDPRLTSLDERLRQARDTEAARSGVKKQDTDRGYSQGNRVISALIGSLVGSALIGWLIDRWFGTAPWGLIVMLFLGIAVAFRQIIRIGGERPE
ncbi:AtpZ/AtpI family protein [Microvirga sp. SRT01]|uniref:AtpZ/AtpI family protein n=1 Tax=Sphingomonas longa TaxID=2778730 RepID=A0ABS2D562_9SPHN|nr:AtpZ/AtpI family protein [Microvirga sp. SRT01]MBM6576054.1 AtpZ/AtpI family protein [Sphingomonas sp. BT552]MBR7709100.1 AtpZ/AtpI family protein [Microvirga sp. SRT01]